MTSLEDIEQQVGAEKYDAVVRIPLFAQAYDKDQGWKLALHEPSIAELDRHTGVRVVPIGHFNAGKTWLLRKLIAESDTALKEMKLATGTDVHTEGFSIKMARLAQQSQKCVFLDTAGLNSPVTSIGALGSLLRGPDGESVANTDAEKMRAMQNMLEELKRHETFIRHVAFDFAQVFLVVVGHISHRDQLDLINLVEQAARCTTAKEVIVVHNLKRMTLGDFNGKKDNQTGDSYLQSMEKVFKLSAHWVRANNEGSEVPELFGAFGVCEVAGADKPKVQIRHLFLTNDDEPEGKHQNGFVLQRIREAINLLSPAAGSVLTDLCKIMTQCAASMVRLPPGKVIELRAHRERRRIFAGVVSKAELDELASSKTKAAENDGLKKLREQATAAKAELEQASAGGQEPTAAQRKAFEQAEEELCEGMALAAGQTAFRVLDAKSLTLLDPAVDPVTCKSITLGSVAKKSNASDKYVRFNVTRMRGWAADVPHWLTSVHMTLPGLAEGQLAAIREQLRWEAGAEEYKATPQSNVSVLFTFDAEVLVVPARQVESLNNAKSKTGKVAVEGTDVQVVDAGSRPFPVRVGAKASEVLHVVVPTDIRNAIREVEPVVTYARGILTVTIACALSEEEIQEGKQAWVQSTEAEMADLPEHEAGANGSEDDADGPRREA